MISIVIPVYNQASKIKQCLKSIFNQTFKDVEVIVVNDGSTDKLFSVLRPFKTKIRLFNRENSGAPTARNFGAKRANGDYLLFCDADIVMKPDMLQKMLDQLKNSPEASFVYSSFKFGFKRFKLWPFSEEKLKQMPYIHTTSLIRRNDFPGFDIALKKFQDWDLWLTVVGSGKCGVFINEVLFRIRSGGTMSSWLPKWLYWVLWLKRVRRYQEAKEIIKRKHKLV
jgi:glycosyltransferase involved in cell wall biosynthesis